MSRVLPSTAQRPADIALFIIVGAGAPPFTMFDFLESNPEIDDEIVEGIAALDPGQEYEWSEGAGGIFTVRRIA